MFQAGFSWRYYTGEQKLLLGLITFDVKLEFSFLEVASSDRNQKKNMQIGNNVQSFSSWKWKEAVWLIFDHRESIYGSFDLDWLRLSEHPYFRILNTNKPCTVPAVEMKEVEIQTDVEEVNLVNAKKDQDDLIRLQSSMTIMQEDHLKERKLLNEKIAELQTEISVKDTIVEEEAPVQQEVRFCLIIVLTCR